MDEMLLHRLKQMACEAAIIAIILGVITLSVWEFLTAI